ncbi:MAG: PDZ domain-containing protein, partial [Bacteroidales bacterium]|nr:PDZ domain-containing protein [Bacteroidales bacterium]
MKKFLFVILFSAISSFMFAQNPTVRDFANKMGQTILYLNNFYLDTVNLTNITDKALEAIVQELDPHSAYISAKDVKAMNEPLIGNFSGIGIEFAIINDTLTVQSTIVGGPSEKVGLKASDKIIKVDDEQISGKDLS